MERIGDDELLCIFKKVPLKEIRSFSQVSKQFLRVACIRLLKLRNSFPDMLYDILPTSPNLLHFECSKPLSNTHMKLLAQSCLKLQSVNTDTDFEFDFDDDGLSALANGCRRLYKVSLSRNLRIGDRGVVSLVRSCKYLEILNLERCVGVSDESLKVIGESRIHTLGCSGCYLITDLGLKYLANGNSKNCLISLDLSECDRITDKGIIYLKQMVRLTELNLSKCGVGVTDYGVLALSSQNPNIVTLHLSWLINVTDISLSAIATNCLELRNIVLSGCEAITGEGLRAFSGHQSLFNVVLCSCHDIFSREDVESFASSFTNCVVIWLSRRQTTPIQEEKIKCGVYHLVWD